MRRGLQGFHPELEFKQMLGQIQDLFQRGPNLERRLLVALNANVQKLIDDVARNSDLVKANNARTEIMSKQITDLQTQLAAIQPGQSVDQENLNGINRAVAQLEETNQALDSAVVAGTSVGPVVAPLGDQGPLTTGTQPVTHDTAGNPIAPDADGQPTPTSSAQSPAPADQPDTPATSEGSKGDTPAVTAEAKKPT